MPIGKMPEMKKRGTDDGERLRQALQRFIDSRGLTVNKWVTKAGVAPNSLRRLLRGKGNTLTHMTLQRLAQAEGVTVEAITGPQERAPQQNNESAVEIGQATLQRVITELERILAEMGGSMEPELKALTVWTLCQMEKRQGTVSASEYENIIKLALFR